MSLQTILLIITACIATGGFLLTYFGLFTPINKKVAEISGELKTLSIKELNEFIGRLKVINFENIFSRIGSIEQRTMRIETTVNSVDLVKMSVGIATMEGEMHRFWDTLNPIINSLVKQPIHYRKDELMDKFPNLSHEELCELKATLQAEMHELTTAKDVKSLAYGLRIIQIDTVLHNREKEC